MSLIDLLERVEKADGPDLELDADLAAHFRLAPGGYTRGWDPDGEPEWTQWQDNDHLIQHCWRAPKLTESIDAALALVERCGEDARTILYDALEHQGVHGWSGDRPMADQIAREVVAELLRALPTKAA